MMAGSATRAMAAYQQVEVTSRSPLELVVMLYDGALGALRQAHESMLRQDVAGKREPMHKALEIVQHLQNTLNMEAGGEIAVQLDQLYRDVVTLVLEANVQSDPEPLSRAIRLLATVRDGWGSIAAAPTADGADHLASAAAAR
jgi:flagellar protein FliS